MAGYLAVCDNDVLLYFPFNDDLHDHSCNMAISQQTSEASVVLAEDSDRGTVAFFNGASSLHVGFIYNYFADRTVTTWSVSMWFKRTGGTESLSGLVNNGDCVGSPSFDLHVGEGQTGSVSVDTDATAAMAGVDGMQVRLGVLFRDDTVSSERNATNTLAISGETWCLAAYGNGLWWISGEHVLEWS